MKTVNRTVFEYSISTEILSVNSQSDGDTLWTLVLTNPDGHFTDNEKEYVHWFV